MEKIYSANLSRSQGREGWSIIFRHPVRLDQATGKPGLRVRRGLQTKDRKEASKLVEQMNEILQEPFYWDAGARAAAEHRFNPLVVDIFYHALVPESTDFFALRDSVIPLPPIESDYRRVLLAGTTGCGKTTVARQLLGTDPEHERFPSTSTGKTTVADMELLLDSGSYRAVVTFLPYDQVRDYVEGCMSAAALAAYRREPKSEVLRRLLNHVSQRFRLTYVLGRGPAEVDVDDSEYEDAESQEELIDTSLDLTQTDNLLSDVLEQLEDLATRHGERLWKELDAVPGDERVVDELFEEELEHFLRSDEDFQVLTDELIEEIGRRFESLPVGELSKTKQGWPRLWSWETENRDSFLKTISRFSSNHARYFGTLLSPLVSGIRVAGPFKPDWAEAQPKLVILDGEGLGHTPDTSASLPTSLSRRFDEVDVVLLIDNAAQPMQAAPVVLMRSLAASGKTAKLVTCFTHLDLVQGDNLPTFRLKREHVLASAENVLTSIGEQLGRFAERALRLSFQRACFFVAGIDRSLDQSSSSTRRTIDQLLSLLTAIHAVREMPEFVGSRPTYDRVNLVLSIKNAAEKFHQDWLARLGIHITPGIPKEHWTRVKALSRRLALGWADEYDTLKPVADLYRNLQNDIYVFVQNPVKWDGPEPQDDEKQQMFDQFAQAISVRILELASQRIVKDHVLEWQDAYNLRGYGSTFQRATTIRDDIYEKAAPVPDVAPSPDRNKFLHEVIDLVGEAAKELEVKLH